MIWSISWKNVWRNRTRSMVVIVAVSLGLLGGIFAVGLMGGMVEQRTRAIVNNELSHIQIHNSNFSDNREIEYTIDDTDGVVEKIKSLPNIKAVCKRTEMMAMASTATNASAILISGIDPENEKLISDIHYLIKDSAGNYFENNKRNQIVIGEKLAKILKLVFYKITDNSISKLKKDGISEDIITGISILKDKKYRTESDFDKALIETIGEKNLDNNNYFLKKHSLNFKIRSKMVVRLQGADNVLVSGAFRVAGIFKTSNSMFDQMTVFVRNDDITELTGLDKSKSHEIVIKLNDISEVVETAKKLKTMLPELSIKTWGELQPDLLLQSSFMEVINYIFVGFILFALGFGIVNTMLMVVLERVKELGMLMAIGMNKRRVFSMIMLETVFLSITGGILGMILSAIALEFTANVGIDTSAFFAEGFEAIGYDPLIYPSIEYTFFVSVTVLVILTGIVASIYPARKALKLNPSEAIRTE